MTFDPHQQYIKESEERILKYSENRRLSDSIKEINHALVGSKYTYNFFWMGRPINQVPEDTIVFQELIWKVKPDLIIETGIAHGGSLIFSASMLVLLEYSGEIKNGEVLGIDIDIRNHNKEAILAHPMNKKITMLEGSSIDPNIVNQVNEIAKNKNRIMVFLDSNHTHDHVLEELRAYTSLVSKGSYCVVCDTRIEDVPSELITDRSWEKGNSPKSAIWDFFKENNDFEIDKLIDSKLLITCAPDGFLKRK